MLKFGLIGCQIGHSLSPTLFKQKYEERCSYELIDCENFENAWKQANENLDAFNVTAPFKEAAFAKVKYPSAACKAIGATNFVLGDRCYNTDYLAAKSLLEDCKAKKVLIIGHGGAGKAAAYAAKELNLQTTICNRSPHPGTRPLSEIPGLCKEADTVVYAIPSPAPDIEHFKGKTVIEANYRSRSVNPADCNYIPGESWLRKQADACFRIIDRRFFPSVISLCGFMGVGKTTAGRLMAEKLGWSFTDLDALVEEKEGRSIADIIRSMGEDGFRAIERCCLEGALNLAKPGIIALGGGTVTFPGSAELVKDTLCIYLEASAGCIRERLGSMEDACKSRPLLSESPEKLLESRIPLYVNASDIIFNTNNKAAEETAEELSEIIHNLQG